MQMFQSVKYLSMSDSASVTAGFHTGFFAGGGKLFRKSKCPCRGVWGYSVQGSLSLDTSC